MFIFSFFTSLYVLLCCFTILIVLVQRGKGSLGMGGLAAGNQALFGSSGGQELFQKITWICCTLLLAGSLFLSVIKSKNRSAISLRSNQSQSLPYSAGDDF